MSLITLIVFNTIHNLEIDECKEAIKEIERVSKNKDSFIIKDAYNTDEEKKNV